ncbi:hypothetical protein [Euryhalocaulis caribicus]|uniref:hypothetical protein n=1 Tax=Euryhalocaulis caribicus TaxID=1161401 RepID=UPI0003AA420F|nr:hypothetical protein [Euryhalocaulis caribicus]
MFIALAAALLVADAAEAQTMLLDACEKQGGTKTECVCGMEVARDKLSDRELILFAEMTPFLDRQDYAQALPEALQHADSLGYTPGEVADAFAIAYEHAEAVEKKCSEDAAAPEG